MVAAAGDEGRKLMEEYRAEHRIES
jgi:hypothetical protein